MRLSARVVLMVSVSVSVAFGLPQPSTQGRSTTEQVSIRAAESWLGLIDSAQYEESWNTAAAAFKAAVTAEKWASAMKSVREPMGKLQTRKLQSATHTAMLPGVPDGDYIVILYETSFEHKATSQETVIMSREKDGIWRTAGYYIK